MNRFRNLSIATKLTLLFVVFAALILAGVGAQAYLSGRAALEQAVISDLGSTANEKQAAINRWLDDRLNLVVSITEFPAYRMRVNSLINDDLDEATRKTLQAQTAQALAGFTGPNGIYTEMMIVEAGQGQVIVSTQLENLAKFNEDRPYFIEGMKGPFVQNVIYSLNERVPMLIVSAPMRADDGRVIAVLAARLKLDQMNEIILRRTGQRETDDEYLVDRSNLFITQPRFITDSAVLQRGIHTEQVNRCLAGNSGVLAANDYRGVPVLAVYRWMPERQLCLIVEMDQAEAFAPSNAFGQTLALIAVATLALASLLGFGLARTITRPVQQLAEAAQEIGAGKLETRIDVKTGDEIGQLARAFVQMAEDLQKTLVSRDDLRKEVTERKQAEETLREQEKHFHSLFENMLNGFAYCRMFFDQEHPQDFIYLEVNHAFETLTGLKDVVGKKVSEVIPGIRESDPELFEIYGRVALTGIPETFETYVEAMKMWFSISVYSPQKEYFVAVFDVITERKQAEEEIQKLNEELEQRVEERSTALSHANALLQTLMDNMPDHIYFKDADGRFIRNSASQARMMGLADPAETIGKTDFDFFPQAHAQRSFDEEQNLIKTGQSMLDIEERVLWPDGQVTWVSTTKLPFHDSKGQVTGTFGISRDITERKRAEETLAKANTQLEAANRELEAFSYSVSHDLRAPLRGIDGWSQALLEDYSEKLDKEGREHIQRVRAETRRMGRLIDDLLELSRITRAEMHNGRVNLSSLARIITERMKEAEPNRQVEILIQKGLIARGDPHLLEVALTNLFDNAFKFTGRVPLAHIEFGQTKIEGERAFYVRDNGAGIDMAYAKKLFGAFQRMHTASEFPGTGIGLATVQRIIHRHGGNIWAVSDVGQGATFYFTIKEHS